ncbi:MAG: hypothetical protein RML95_15740 [Anaerolineae bacterium]|nr:hypothetical protein [Anaerolineae bacterium]
MTETKYRAMEPTDYMRSLLERFKQDKSHGRDSLVDAPLPERAVRNAQRQIRRHQQALAKAKVRHYRPLEPTPHLRELLAKFTDAEQCDSN